jgi:hypothetical protein
LPDASVDQSEVNVTRSWRLLVVLAASFAVQVARAQAPEYESTVGMPVSIEGVVLPGTELAADELRDRKSPVVLRVARVYPHGTAFRYDFEFTGLEPGTYDLRDHLLRKDKSPRGDLPPIVVKVNPVLPPGQVLPNQLEIESGPRVGGYRTLVIVLVAAWVVGLVLLIASFFFPRRKHAETASDRPVSLAERLRPLVEGAVAGKLSRPELASLERALLAFWRKRLRLESAEPAAAMEAMRKHSNAGPLLAQLETWLHRPGPPAAVDVPALLAPYRDLPPEAIDLANGKEGPS